MSPELESFVVSLGILVIGVFTIPLAGMVAGVKIRKKQAFVMSLLFFLGRWAWVYAVRMYSIHAGVIDIPSLIAEYYVCVDNCWR